MNASPSAPDAHQDRSTGLLVFGILTVIMGCLCGLFGLLMISSQSLAARDPALGDTRGVIFATATYFGLAIAFVWLGIGSIRARRWARTLLVVISWGWLLIGVGSLLAMVFLFPAMFSESASSGAKIDPAVQGVIMAIALGFTGVLFFLIPGAWALFYSSKNVRATFEHRDPVIRWTDRCPLPVLAVSLWTALGAPGMLLMPVAGMAVLPFFGNFLAGWPAAWLCVGLGLLWVWAAWRLYRLDILGWWVVVASVVLFAISSVLTYSRHTLTEFYALMGYSQAQIDQIQKFALPPWFLTWGVLVWVLPVLAYLIFILRYLRRSPAGA
jgi:hypothetical protein